MLNKLKKWYRRRRLIKAYKILRNEAGRHVVAGHEMMFEFINESHVKMMCRRCPELQPMNKSGYY